jgi:CYTH domain-containing protein
VSGVVDRPRYARWEHERRFVVRPDDVRFLAGKPCWRLVEDRYLSCGRLRLRKLTDSVDGAVTCKLTKKYPPASALSQPIVSIFLSSEEHTALGALTGADLRKRRYYEDCGGRVFAVDVFEGPLVGLVLGSVEANTLEELERVALPDYAGPEVTHDAFFEGGRLCVATAAELEAALARTTRRPPRGSV